MSAVRVVGLDLSTARTGIALADGTCRSVTPKAPGNDQARRLHELVERITIRVRTGQVDLVVIEGYLPGGPGAIAMLRLAELGGAIRLRLWEQAIPYIEIQPSSLKLFATGNGRASKDDMVAAARRFGADALNHDEADAWLLRLAALQHYQPNPELPSLTPTLERLAWPTIKETTRARCR